MERFPRKISRIEPLNLVGTARCAVRAAFSGATMPPAASRAGASQRDVPTKVRFTGRDRLRGRRKSCRPDSIAWIGKLRPRFFIFFSSTLLFFSATRESELWAEKRDEQQKAIEPRFAISS